MKIAYCSDLHLEFGDLDIKNTEGASVLVLAGDIMVERDLDMYDRRQIEHGFMRAKSVQLHGFFDRVCAEFSHVIYVMGNHEHYDGDFAKTGNELKRKLAHHTNLHVLDREVFALDDVTFIGATLWTDMNKRDDLTLYHMTRMMNDFRCIQNSNRVVNFRAEVLKNKPVGMTDEEFMAQPPDERHEMVFKTRTARFSPQDAADEHDLTLGYIRSVVEGKSDQKFVVVGHHSPSKQSTHPRYQHDTVMNGGYSSDLSEFILDHPQIKVWFHGHTHHDFEYQIGSTTIACNPRGYIGYESQAQDFQLRHVEV